MVPYLGGCLVYVPTAHPVAVVVVTGVPKRSATGSAFALFPCKSYLFRNSYLTTTHQDRQGDQGRDTQPHNHTFTHDTYSMQPICSHAHAGGAAPRHVNRLAHVCQYRILRVAQICARDTEEYAMVGQLSYAYIQFYGLLRALSFPERKVSEATEATAVASGGLAPNSVK
jgi:hypothetical protein